MTMFLIGRWKVFMKLFEIIQSWIPSPSTFKKARELHALILTTATTLTAPFPFNHLISIYSLSGSPGDALKVFDTMPQRNLVSFNSAICTCSKSPHLAGAAWGLLLEMGRVGYRPNGFTFAHILRVSTEAKDLLSGMAIHSKVESSGCLGDACVNTALLGLYSNCGDAESANRVFAGMEWRDVVSWNAVILANVRNGSASEGLRLFTELLREGIVPTEFTFSVVLSACRRLADKQMGEIVHAMIAKLEYLIDTTLQNSLLTMYSGSGDFPAALRVFDEIRVPELVSWNSMISGYLDNGDVDSAMKLFVRMLSMASDRIMPDDYTYAALVSATIGLPAALYGKPLHAQIEKFGVTCSIYVNSTLIDMYFCNGEPESACRIFNSLWRKDHIIWTSMIVGHSRAGEGEIAVQHFYNMIAEGHKVDSFSLSSALSSCADLGRLKQGQMVHSLALRTGYNVDICVSGSLIDMYAKNGDLESARTVFEIVMYPDLKCWNAMLGGYANNGHIQHVFELFKGVTESGLEPDHVTFLSLLSACCHSGLLGKGRLCWEGMMIRGLVPGPKHYACMVNLLSRSGLLREAESLIMASPFSSGFPEMWRALLSSCVSFKELEIGSNAAERILVMDPHDGSTLIMLSNLYASVGKWEEVSNIRRRIRGLMLEKDPGLSWLENESKVHVFSAADESYVHGEEAQLELLRLHINLKPLDDSDLTNMNYMTNVHE